MCKRATQNKKMTWHFISLIFVFYTRMRKQEKGERSRERKRMSGAGQKQNVTWGEKSRQSKEETEGGDADKSVRDSEK